MRYLSILILILFPFALIGQRITPSTETFRITGKIKKEIEFSLASLDTFPAQEIGNLTLSNQEGEYKATLKVLKGIPLKNLLSKVEIEVEKPKMLNEFYFTFIAVDNYKAVFSWNEIFNTETGNNLFLITEMNGKKLKEMDERIMIVSTKDFVSGRRCIRGLDRIVVGRVD